MMLESGPVGCGWRTGDALCRMLVARGTHCAWHRHWLRVVGAGWLDAQQPAAFREWWEQFQPWGSYASNPGPWWAAVEVLWAALTGVAEAPVLTPAVAEELRWRRVEVARMRVGLPSVAVPGERLTGWPLPPWEPADWRAKVVA